MTIFLFRMKDSSQKRHVAKTITWRIIGTLDTVLLAWFISGDPLTGVKIGFAEVVTKMILYFIHERLWFRSDIQFSSGKWRSRTRHIFKTVSWRIIGTVDTVLLAWIITGNPLTGAKIGLAEVITKMVLYYLHERIWYRIDFGVEDRRKGRNSTLEILEPQKKV